MKCPGNLKYAKTAAVRADGNHLSLPDKSEVGSKKHFELSRIRLVKFESVI